MTAFATLEELIEFTASGTLDALNEPERLLERATTKICRYLRASFILDDETGLPSDVDVAAALRDAVCAQVEFWAETGEEHAIDGLAGTTYSVTGYSGQRPPDLAPRAWDIMREVGFPGQPGQHIPAVIW